MTLIWHGGAVENKLRMWSRERVQRVCFVTERLVKKSMKRGGRTESGFAKAGEKAKRTGSYRSEANEPPRVQTGRLRGSITHEMHSTLPIGRVGTNVKYARMLEFGTPPHTIKVKNAKVLMNRKTGQVFGRRVKHPGMAPRPFMRPALEKIRGLAYKIFSEPVK